MKVFVNCWCRGRVFVYCEGRFVNIVVRLSCDGYGIGVWVEYWNGLSDIVGILEVIGKVVGYI